MVFFGILAWCFFGDGLLLALLLKSWFGAEGIFAAVLDCTQRIVFIHIMSTWLSVLLLMASALLNHIVRFKGVAANTAPRKKTMCCRLACILCGTCQNEKTITVGSCYLSQPVAMRSLRSQGLDIPVRRNANLDTKTFQEHQPGLQVERRHNQERQFGLQIDAKPMPKKTPNLTPNKCQKNAKQTPNPGSGYRPLDFRVFGECHSVLAFFRVFLAFLWHLLGVFFAFGLAFFWHFCEPCPDCRILRFGIYLAFDLDLPVPLLRFGIYLVSGLELLVAPSLPAAPAGNSSTQISHALQNYATAA